MVFHENWYSDEQIAHLIETLAKVRRLKGLVIEIGCWEGRSTVVIANACYPEPVHAVDTWKGNLDESKVTGTPHPTTTIALERDVFVEFSRNIAELTGGNVVPHRQDCFDYLAHVDGLVKFCHIDASHDYFSVKRTIGMLLPRLVEGGVLCGDDFQAASAARKDLQGGVERAVRETLAQFQQAGNFWWYRHAHDEKGL